jgi:hypothetical protein
MRHWTGWKAVFSERSVPMAAHATMDTATEERCFLWGPCLHVKSRKISGASSVKLEDCCSSVDVSCCCVKLVAEARGQFGNPEGGDVRRWKRRVHELARAFQLLVITICKWLVNPITNPNSVCSQTFGNISDHQNEKKNEGVFTALNSCSIGPSSNFDPHTI